MNFKILIILVFILFCIYCFQKSNNNSQVLENFNELNGNEVNLLPPLVDIQTVLINVPFKDVVGGSMTPEGSDNSIILHSTESGKIKSYTNHFVFTPLAKTKKVILENDKYKLKQRTFVLSGKCRNRNHTTDAPVASGQVTGSPQNNITVETSET